MSLPGRGQEEEEEEAAAAAGRKRGGGGNWTSQHPAAASPLLLLLVCSFFYPCDTDTGAAHCAASEAARAAAEGAWGMAVARHHGIAADWRRVPRWRGPSATSSEADMAAIIQHLRGGGRGPGRQGHKWEEDETGSEGDESNSGIFGSSSASDPNRSASRIFGSSSGHGHGQDADDNMQIDEDQGGDEERKVFEGRRKAAPSVKGTPSPPATPWPPPRLKDPDQLVSTPVARRLPPDFADLDAQLQMWEHKTDDTLNRIDRMLAKADEGDSSNSYMSTSENLQPSARLGQRPASQVVMDASDMFGDEGTPVQRVVSSQLAGSEGIVDESWASASSPVQPPPHLSRRGSRRTKSHSLLATASGNRDGSDAAAGDGDGDGDGTSGKRNAARGENEQGTESESQEKGWGMDYGGISGKSGVGSGRKFAEVAYRKALESNPGDVDTIYRYASYLHTVKGDGKGAHSLYAKALSLDPLHLSSLSKMGKLISDETGDSKAAERLFCRALMVDPGHVPVLLDRAYLKWRAVGDLGGAADLFQKAIDLDGDGEFVDVGVLCAFAGLLEDKGELERAEGMYERAIAWDGQHVTSLFNYGLMLEEGLKEHGRASQMYRRVLELDPSHFFTLANYGGLLDSVMHDYDAAEELYKRALGIQPNDAATLHNYAGLLEEVRGDAEGALQLFKRASEARPLNVDSILASSRLSLDMGRDLDETEAILKRALEIEPGSASAVRHYVRYLIDVKADVSGASWMLERLMGTEASRDADTLVLKADIIRKRRVEGMAAGAEGDKEEKEVGAREEEGFAGSASIESAVEMYSQALKQKPSHQRARVGLARAKGDQDSEVAIREVVKESPHSVLAWKDLGGLLEERGGHLAARRAFEMALSLCPRDTLCLERAAVLCEAEGDDAAHALSLWERLLEIVPGHKGGLEAKMKQCDDLEELNARFKAATEASPTDAELAIAYSVLLESRVGDRARAGSVLDKALDLDQWNVDLLCRRARVSLGGIPLSQHHCDEAQGLYQRAMEANPSHLDTLLGYAEFLDKIRGHAPEYVEGLYARAAAEHSLDPRALVAYANYLQFTCLGERNVQLEEEENTRVAVQAGQLYETALMLDPSHYEALHGYGLYQRNELYDNQGALICYNMALELRPNDPILLCNMATALSSTQPQDAEALARRAVELEPDCEYAWATLGTLVEERTGNVTAGQEYFERACNTTGVKQAGENLKENGGWGYVYEEEEVDMGADAQEVVLDEKAKAEADHKARMDGFVEFLDGIDQLDVKPRDPREYEGFLNGIEIVPPGGKPSDKWELPSDYSGGDSEVQVVEGQGSDAHGAYYEGVVGKAAGRESQDSKEAEGPQQEMWDDSDDFKVEM